MGINGISGSMASQLYQLPVQSSGGKAVQQAQPAQKQGPAEESMESASMKSREASQGGESKETKSINTYA